MTGFIALKLGLETLEADAVDAYYQPPEHEEVIVDPAPEYFKRLEAAGKNKDSGKCDDSFGRDDQLGEVWWDTWRHPLADKM